MWDSVNLTQSSLGVEREIIKRREVKGFKFIELPFVLGNIDHVTDGRYICEDSIP